MKNSEKIAIAFLGAIPFPSTASRIGPAYMTQGVHRGADGAVYGVRRVGPDNDFEAVLVEDEDKLAVLAVPTNAEREAACVARIQFDKDERRFWSEYAR